MLKNLEGNAASDEVSISAVIEEEGNMTIPEIEEVNNESLKLELENALALEQSQSAKYSRKVLYCTRRNFTPTRIPILKISSKSDIYALDTPGRKLDPAARESVLSGICSLPRADLLEVLNTLFLSLGDDIARIPALNNFVIAKGEEKVLQNTINEPSGKGVKKEQFPSLPPTKGNPWQSSITVQRKRSCRSDVVQDVESCRTYNIDVSNKFESIANVDDTDMRMDENYSPGADPSLQCMPGPSHEEIQIPNQKPRESKIINNNDEQMDNNEDQGHMQEARKQQVPPITVRDKMRNKVDELYLLLEPLGYPKFMFFTEHWLLPEEGLQRVYHSTPLQ
ncbi:hypothetical protein JTB14_019075 [Gonioctena quinquepunctata]|nr:hypothetical protein JTB14_019075 [Gonioctena quinquepunctata]